MTVGPGPQRRRLWWFEDQPLNWSAWCSPWPVTREQALRQRRAVARISLPLILIAVFGGILLEFLGLV